MNTDLTLNVICLKWGTKYPAEYVNKLYRMVHRNLTVPHRFICVTDDSVGLEPGIETKPLLDPELKGWWHKLSLFRSELYDLKGTLLFFDLDVVITGNLDRLIDYQPGKFCILNDLSKPNMYNSSVFRVPVGEYAFIWESFQKQSEEVITRLYGDQDWVSEIYTEATLWPESWMLSYKKQMNARSKRSYGLIGKKLRQLGVMKTTGTTHLPSDCSAVIFHGKPDPEDVKDGPYDVWMHAPWINDHWR